MHQGQAVVGSDTVIDVHNVIAGLQILQIGKERRNLLPATMLLGQVYGFLGAWRKGIRLAEACGIVASRTRSPLTPRG